MSESLEDNTTRLERAGHTNLTDPVFQAQMAELDLPALIIILLAWAMKLLGQRSIDASA